MNTKNSSWLGGWMGLVPQPPEAQCHLPMFSTSQPGTGRCWRTAAGEDLASLVVAKRLDVAGALGGTGAMDTVDMVVCMDEGLRLAKGTLRHDKTRKGTDRHVKARYFERVIFFLACRKGHSPVSAPMAKEGVPIGTVSRIVPQCPRLSGGIFMFFFSELSHPGGCGCPVPIWAGAWKRRASSRDFPQPPGGILFFVLPNRPPWGSQTNQTDPFFRRRCTVGAARDTGTIVMGRSCTSLQPAFARKSRVRDGRFARKREVQQSGGGKGL
jgi:hypothetical protein